MQGAPTKKLTTRDGAKQVRPWTFFENGVVGHVSMADPFDVALSKAVHDAISQPGVLQGEAVKTHSAGTVICIGTTCGTPAATSPPRLNKQRKAIADR